MLEIGKLKGSQSWQICGETSCQGQTHRSVGRVSEDASRTPVMIQAARISEHVPSPPPQLSRMTHLSNPTPASTQWFGNVPCYLWSKCKNTMKMQLFFMKGKEEQKKCLFEFSSEGSWQCRFQVCSSVAAEQGAFGGKKNQIPPHAKPNSSSCSLKINDPSSSIHFCWTGGFWDSLQVSHWRQQVQM